MPLPWVDESRFGCLLCMGLIFVRYLEVFSLSIPKFEVEKKILMIDEIDFDWLQ